MATERLNDVWLVGATWWQGCRELLLQVNCFCKAMAVSQAFIFHFKWYSILYFAVCQLLCWAFLFYLITAGLCPDVGIWSVYQDKVKQWGSLCCVLTCDERDDVNVTDDSSRRYLWVGRGCWRVLRRAATGSLYVIIIIVIDIFAVKSLCLLF